ncbi:MAG: hypothetical protein WBV45_14300 [Lutimonas sp.]
METNKIFEVLAFTLPAIVTGLVAMYFFKTQASSDEKRRNFQIRKEGQKIALPLRLQAYERLTLFLERISPSKLLLRVKPTGKDTQAYAQKLIGVIEQEFEHNLAQQIYVSETAWKAVKTSKSVMVKIIRSAADNEDVKDISGFQEEVLKSVMQQEGPAGAALGFLRLEVQKLF